MSALSWGQGVRLSGKSVNQGHVIGLDGKGCTLQKETEMADSFEDGENFSVEGGGVSFSLKEFATKESQRTCLFVDELFQNNANGDVVGICGKDERLAELEKQRGLPL